MPDTKGYLITTDNNADLPGWYIEENHLGVTYFTYALDDISYRGDDPTMGIHDFYDKMRSGSLAKTQQINPDQAMDFFRKYVKEGYDLVHIYQLNMESGKLELNSQTPIRPASCARHVAFHPNRKNIYLAAEYTSKVYAFDYDTQKGVLSPLQILSTERSMYTGNYCKCSEIAVHPNGKFLYISNRGDDTIGVFSIDGQTGKLSPIGWTETQGEIPRYFCLNETGTKLYVANQKSGNVAVFDVDVINGTLSWNAPLIYVPCPTWILFL